MEPDVCFTITNGRKERVNDRVKKWEKREKVNLSDNRANVSSGLNMHG